MKRYLLFCFDSYYPGGGWNDFVDSFDSVYEANKRGASDTQENFQIVDSTTGKTILEAYRG